MNQLPLQDIRVLEFCWMVAGPYACMLLATLGAEVIRVESHKRTDLMRRTVVWPVYEPTPVRVPPNQGMLYNYANRNKRSVTLDLTEQEGLELARRLVAMSDAVINNMRPSAMIKMGLGYDELRKLKSDIIVVSSSSRGHEGPERDCLGYATIHQSIGGLSYITGYPDDHPSHGTPADADMMNATAAAFALLAALFHRARTGEGQFIDYSQCEGSSALIGEQLLGYAMSKRIPERMGNAHPEYAPHGVYRCWGVDRWIAIEVHTDEEFTRLADIMGRPDLPRDPRFASRASRKRNEAQLDLLVEAWTNCRDRDWMVEELCAADIAAAPARDEKDLYADRHLHERRAFMKVNHPELGELELVGLPWKISDLDTPANPAPLLGQHNQFVLQELLGLDDGEINSLRTKGVIL